MKVVFWGVFSLQTDKKKEYNPSRGRERTKIKIENGAVKRRDFVRKIYLSVEK